MCSKASPVNLSSRMVALKFVFNRLSAEKLRSLLAVDEGRVADTCRSTRMFGNVCVFRSQCQFLVDPKASNPAITTTLLSDPTEPSIAQ